MVASLLSIRFQTSVDYQGSRSNIIVFKPRPFFFSLLFHRWFLIWCFARLIRLCPHRKPHEISNQMPSLVPEKLFLHASHWILVPYKSSQEETHRTMLVTLTSS